MAARTRAIETFHRPPVISRLATAFVLTWAMTIAALAEEPQGGGFFDATDGQFDISDFLLHRKGLLPVPIIITEPAVGYGGGVMLLFFSESLADAGAKAKEEGKPMAPPNITGVGGFVTENGSRGVGLAHFHTWGGDRYRYLGALGATQMHLDYYGRLNKARSYELEGKLLVQQLLVRIGDSNWYAGPRYTYFNADTKFDGPVAEELGDFKQSRTIGKAGLVVDYDTRDNMFDPNRGSYMELEAQIARGWLASSQSFETYHARGYTWLPIVDRKWTLGLRADAQTTSGDVPFYAKPFINLRGVSMGQYQDQSVAVLEAELRWRVTPRWSVLAFGGVGKAFGEWHSFSEASTVSSVGAGFRYLIARKMGLSVGIDIAHSKDQDAFYIQVGSAWH